MLTISNRTALDYLKRQIHFVATIPKKVLVGAILCLYLCFIVIFLEPFDTRQFEADYRIPLLAGYGILTGIIYVLHSCLENIWYFKSRKVWLTRNELPSSILFFLFSGTVLYLYNRYIVNQNEPDLASYCRFLSITVLYMIPVFLPVMLLLRQKFGELVIPPVENSISLNGENKNEVLQLEKKDLLYVKAVENYVEICFIDSSARIISKTFRQTLSNVWEQLPYLEKCHRSYLINISTIKEINGNSQGAKITLRAGEKEIPLSKSFYKQVKKSWDLASGK